MRNKLVRLKQSLLNKLKHLSIFDSILITLNKDVLTSFIVAGGRYHNNMPYKEEKIHLINKSDLIEQAYLKNAACMHGRRALFKNPICKAAFCRSRPLAFTPLCARKM